MFTDTVLPRPISAKTVGRARGTQLAPGGLSLPTKVIPRNGIFSGFWKLTIKIASPTASITIRWVCTESISITIQEIILACQYSQRIRSTGAHYVIALGQQILPHVHHILASCYSRWRELWCACDPYFRVFENVETPIP